MARRQDEVRNPATAAQQRTAEGYDPTGQMAAPPPQPQYMPQQGYGMNGGHDAGAMARRYVHTPETKEFFRTSEFLVWFLLTAAVLLSAAIHENFDAPDAWPLAIGLSAAYIISRGVAKSGSRRGDPERSDTNSFGSY
jgi:hypothetical protein